MSYNDQTYLSKCVKIKNDQMFQIFQIFQILNILVK
jgi:hypothetical protein